MNLLKKIKSLFNRKEPKLETTITTYDTTLVGTPEYSELSSEEQSEVKRFQSEVNLDSIETIILYAGKMAENAGNELNLLYKNYMKLTEQQDKRELKEMTLDEREEQRFQSIINEEVLQIYLEELEKLRRESILRTVAIRELIINYPKRRIEFLRVFGIAERMKRKDQMDQLLAAEQRMKITTKNIGDLIQIAKNSITSEEMLNRSLSVHDFIEESGLGNSDEIEASRKKAIYRKADKIIKLAASISGKDIKMQSFGKVLGDEREVARNLARFQREIDLYAYTHTDEVEELKRRVESL